tara:strand:+ start:1235 stop:2467 length:1233 start_codon:yes stop_codon:yes gene_type:complete
MELQLFGINHKTSVISEREKFIINESNQIILDNHLKRIFKDDFESFFGISTCNRTELYFVAKAGIAEEVFYEVIKILDITDIPKDRFYFLSNHNALSHMCKVASGIDSQVLGEQEIFGQFKSALKKATDQQMVGKKLSFFSKKVIEISKTARTDTEIGLNPLSVSGLAMKLIENIFEIPEEQNVLVVGAGSLAISVMENLYRNGIKNINSINRSIKNIKLNNKFEIVSSSLDALHNQIQISDIVIASATTEIPLIGKGAVENALSIRKNKPILIIDLGVPRNVEDEIRNIEQVYLFSIDDVEKITQENFGQRSIEAEKAMNIIAIEAQKALESFDLKTVRDKINIQLDAFLKNLSSDEIKQFKESKDYSELVKSIKTININDTKLNNYKDIKQTDDHIIESMIKRFFTNA